MCFWHPTGVILKYYCRDTGIILSCYYFAKSTLGWISLERHLSPVHGLEGLVSRSFWRKSRELNYYRRHTGIILSCYNCAESTVRWFSPVETPESSPRPRRPGEQIILTQEQVRKYSMQLVFCCPYNGIIVWYHTLVLLLCQVHFEMDLFGETRV